MHIPEEIIITCDLHFHLDNKSDCDGRKFIEMLSDRGLVQHVIGATHVSGHTLDVIISRDIVSRLRRTVNYKQSKQI
jgi:hypothetical protein